jgi:hypothetical protein
MSSSNCSSLQPKRVGKVAATPYGENITPEAYEWGKAYRVIGAQDEEPMQVVQLLGNGSIGVVEEVRRLDTTSPTLVRKRVKISVSKRLAETITQIVREEISTLTRLQHPNLSPSLNYMRINGRLGVPYTVCSCFQSATVTSRISRPLQANRI